ncbi:hypothetical protein IMSAG049_00409 [Clostridiales bacterium]|nr:hypothetical protein IMSAG049_00409 [Clostridiales bacterium]
MLENERKMSETAKRRLMEIIDEAEEVSRIYPTFNLDREFESPIFRRLMAAGVPVITAYELIHRNELNDIMIEKAVRNTERRISKAIQTGATRPHENGHYGASQSVVSFDPKNLSKEERNNIKERVRRGENIYF